MNKLERIVVSTAAKIKYMGKCVIEQDAVVYGNCIFEGMNKISPGAHVTSTSMGYASYIGKNSIFSHAKIGRFCSIGDNVRLVRATHPIRRFVSTHPAFYSTATRSSFVSADKYKDIVEDEKGISLYIGSDVWIGNNVLIKAGINIGNGAVIAMGAVVTKDVPDYAIVGGTPEKILRYRFSEETRMLLNESKWWDRDIEWIQRNAELFEDVDKFLNELIK